jgi:hypothetical protein
VTRKWEYVPFEASPVWRRGCQALAPDWLDRGDRAGTEASRGDFTFKNHGPDRGKGGSVLSGSIEPFGPGLRPAQRRAFRHRRGCGDTAIAIGGVICPCLAPYSSQSLIEVIRLRR